MSEPEKTVGGESPASPSPAPAPAPGSSGPAHIGIDAFQAVELRAGKVVEAAPHPDAERLLVLKVDIGEAQPRQIVAGIRSDWSPEALMGRTVVIVANLKPARLRGLESQGMLLAVKGREKVIPLGIDGDVAPGTRVT